MASENRNNPKMTKNKPNRAPQITENDPHGVNRVKKECRELCRFLIIEEKDTRESFVDDNNPFEMIPRCSHVEKLRVISPDLDRQLGAIDNICIVSMMPHTDHSQWPHWCPTTFDYKELQWAIYHHYLPKYPSLKKINRCKICKVPIITNQGWDGLCLKCSRNTRDISSQPQYMLGSRVQTESDINRYYGDDLDVCK